MLYKNLFYFDIETTGQFDSEIFLLGIGFFELNSDGNSAENSAENSNGISYKFKTELLYCFIITKYLHKCYELSKLIGLNLVIMFV